MTQHQHASQKGVELGVKIEWGFFCDVNKQYTLVFGDANELAVFLRFKWIGAMWIDCRGSRSLNQGDRTTKMETRHFLEQRLVAVHGRRCLPQRGDEFD